MGWLGKRPTPGHKYFDLRLKTWAGLTQHLWPTLMLQRPHICHHPATVQATDNFNQNPSMGGSRTQQRMLAGWLGGPGWNLSATKGHPTPFTGSPMGERRWLRWWGWPAPGEWQTWTATHAPCSGNPAANLCLQTMRTQPVPGDKKAPRNVRCKQCKNPWEFLHRM